MKNYKNQEGCWCCWNNQVSYNPYQIFCAFSVVNFNELSDEEKAKVRVDDNGICDNYEKCNLFFMDGENKL